MLPLYLNLKRRKCYSQEEWKLNQDAKPCYIFGKRILKKLAKSKNDWKIRDHCHYGGK